jgi:hypothetical protein
MKFERIGLKRNGVSTVFVTTVCTHPGWQVIGSDETIGGLNVYHRYLALNLTPEDFQRRMGGHPTAAQ